jgi:hypothetical protein
MVISVLLVSVSMPVLRGRDTWSCGVCVVEVSVGVIFPTTHQNVRCHG